MGSKIKACKGLNLQVRIYETDMIFSSAAERAEKVSDIQHGLDCMRVAKRRTVVWPATLHVAEFEFSTTMYDISLSGLRLKLALPLARGTSATVNIKGQVTLNARVVWSDGKFVGLKFCDPIDMVRQSLGELASDLE